MIGLRSTRRLLLGGCVLPLALLAGSLAALDAHASYVICRTDPTVHLSNGTVVSMSADTQDTASDIKGVTYVLHAPRGTTVTSVTYDSYGYLEHFTFYADRGPRSYLAYTTVSTGTRKQTTIYTSVSKDTGTTSCQDTDVRGTSTNTTVKYAFSC